MFQVKFLFFVLLVVFGRQIIAEEGQAYGWASGGGESYLFDSQNPWFLENTTEVNYCIDMDEEHFGTDLQTAQSSIERALEYWKNSFEKRQFKIFAIATQNFRLVEDCENAELKFQLGKLRPSQIDKFSDPWNYVGRTIRTEYDRVHLRGKGFVYIAPSTGLLKAIGGYHFEKPWQEHNGHLLYLVLVHELGHVFGLSGTRTSNSKIDEVMAENYPHFVVKYLTLEHSDLIGLPSPKPYYSLDKILYSTSYISEDKRENRKFFGIDNSINCIRVKMLSRNDLDATYGVFGFTDPSNQCLISESKMIEFGKIDLFLSESGLETTILIELTKDQEVFPSLAGRNLIIPSSSRFTYGVFGKYTSIDGTIKREISGFISDAGRGQYLLGVLDSRLTSILY